MRNQDNNFSSSEYSPDQEHSHGHSHGVSSASEHSLEHVSEHSHEHASEHSHEHASEHSHEHASEHSHEHLPEHGHFHDPAEQKRRINRLAKAIGHLEYVKRMMEEDADCADVLMQISAVQAALDSLGKSIIKDHMSHCIVHAIEDGDTESVESFMKAIEKYL